MQPRHGRRRRAEQRLDARRRRHLEVQLDSLFLDDCLAAVLVEVDAVLVVVGGRGVVVAVITVAVEIYRHHSVLSLQSSLVMMVMVVVMMTMLVRLLLVAGGLAMSHELLLEVEELAEEVEVRRYRRPLVFDVPEGRPSKRLVYEVTR